MGYTALYRKLRPTKFSEVFGQDHIVRTLQNQLLSGRVSHAYLFCGTRGTGKTSTAKIFAKVINCQLENTIDACGNCECCQAIAENRSMNVVEIDAASNNGVDNIRDIREEVKYPPAVGKFKVYIIDEVHMLSTGAFNALLKTLEEPPEHVVFVLATTDPQKIPATILSRCQRFDFHRISAETMTMHLKQFMIDENISIEDAALRYVAKTADGAARDALSVLDQCISFYANEVITLDKVLELTGSVDGTVFFALTKALSEHNTNNALELINDVVMRGRDVSALVSAFVAHLRNLLVALASPHSETALDFSDDNKALFLEQAKNLTPQRVISYIHAFSELQSRMKFAANAQILLEVACIRLCNPEAQQETSLASTDTKQLLDRLNTLEKQLNNHHQPIQTKGSTQQQSSTPDKPKAQKAIPEDIKQVGLAWQSFTATFPSPEKEFLSLTKPGFLGDQWLYVVCEQIGHVSYLKAKEESIKNKLTEQFGKEFALNITTKALYNQNHKQKFGHEDDFSFQDAVNTIKETLRFDNIEVQE